MNAPDLVISSEEHSFTPFQFSLSETIPLLSTTIGTILLRKVKHAPEQSFIELFEIGFKGITLLQTVLERITLKMFL